MTRLLQGYTGHINKGSDLSEDPGTSESESSDIQTRRVAQQDL